MDVVCVKWGDKFSHEHVNRLYRMVCKNFHTDFRFVCHTDNPEGIHSDVHIIPLPDYDLEKWWWKLALFENISETQIYLDLDVIIQKDFTHFQDYVVEDKLCLVKAYWKPYVSDVKFEFDVDINSSIMIWKGDLRHIWKDYDVEYCKFKYEGIDRYLYYDKGEHLVYIPEGELYSRRYGLDWENFNLFGLEDKLYKDEDKTICIFDGWKLRFGDEAYDGFEEYYN